MSAPRTPGIYIIMMTLVTAVTLAWSTLVASSIEIGFFWTSLASALSVSLYAWKNGDRMGQSGMLLVYVMLACSLTLVVASLFDLTNVTFLGDKYDAESGLLLGGVISFCLLAVLATRLSGRFPGALAWGGCIALLMAQWYGKEVYKTIESTYHPIIMLAVIVCGMTAFICLCLCKYNLSDSRYLSLLCLIMTFIAMPMPGSKENLTAAILVSLMLTLSGILFFTVRSAVPSSVFVGGLMFLYSGVSSIITDVFQKWLGMNEILAGIPSLVFGLLVVCWLKFRKDSLPRGLYWVSQTLFSGLSILSVIPERYSETCNMALFGAVILFVLSCIWYAPPAVLPPESSWRNRYRLTGVSCTVILVLLLTNLWFKQSINMLIYNTGPARLIARLQGTPFWPGDKTFVRLAMRDESLWPDRVRTAAEDITGINKFIKAIRPRGDRFSKVISTADYKQNESGIESESIGLRWAPVKDSLTLMKVDRKSPAGEKGLVRGDRVVTINGVQAKELIDKESWEKRFGTWKADSVVSLGVVSARGKKRTVSMTIGSSQQDPPMSRVIHTASGTAVGYLFLEGFDSDQFKYLEHHFATFKKEGIRDLVLDLRYNPGGRISNASTLADLIAGIRLNGRLFVKTEHSLRYEDRSNSYVFTPLADSISIRRLVVLTTDETCSASEALINGLRPHMPVYTVGATTCGKPYVFMALRFGDKTLLPVTARVLNSNGEGHYTRGIRPDFKAEDDLTRQLGDLQEGMLKKALEVLDK